MLPEYFAVIGSLLASSGGFLYLYHTIRGTVQPNKVTWFFWGAFPMIAFFAQRAQDVDWLAWATFAAGFTPFLIIIAATFNPKAYWKLESRDYICLGVALIGVFLWMLTNEPNLAILFAILADLAAGLPTIIKSYKYPGSESWGAYALSALGFAIAVASVHIWTFEYYGFVAYLFAINLLLAILALRRQPTIA